MKFLFTDMNKTIKYFKDHLILVHKTIANKIVISVTILIVYHPVNNQSLHMS